MYVPMGVQITNKHWCQSYYQLYIKDGSEARYSNHPAHPTQIIH